jgi:hypothetical protein
VGQLFNLDWFCKLKARVVGFGPSDPAGDLHSITAKNNLGFAGWKAGPTMRAPYRETLLTLTGNFDPAAVSSTTAVRITFWRADLLSSAPMGQLRKAATS